MHSYKLRESAEQTRAIRAGMLYIRIAVAPFS